MAEKITSLAGLKKWFEDEIEKTKDMIMNFKREEWAEGTWERLQGYLSALTLVLEKINGFEAGLREQLSSALDTARMTSCRDCGAVKSLEHLLEGGTVADPGRAAGGR